MIITPKKNSSSNKRWGVKFFGNFFFSAPQIWAKLPTGIWYYLGVNLFGAPYFERHFFINKLCTQRHAKELERYRRHIIMSTGVEMILRALAVTHLEPRDFFSSSFSSLGDRSRNNFVLRLLGESCKPLRLSIALWVVVHQFGEDVGFLFAVGCLFHGRELGLRF